MQASTRLTIVSGLFDLGRREPSVRRWPVEHYLRDAGFMGELDVDVVLFVDPELEDRATRARALSGRLDRTHVVPAPLESMPPMAHLERIAAARSANPVLNASPRKDTPLFTALTWAKFAMVEQAIELDPFGASHFAWMDYGLGGVANRDHVEDGVFSQPPERVRLLMMRPFQAGDLADRQAYYSHLRGHVAGGYFSGGKVAMEDVCRLFATTAEQELDRGLAPSEEQLLPVLCTAKPELFEFHHGEYEFVLENFAHARGSADNLLFQLRCCRESGDFRLGGEIGRQVLSGVRNGTFVCYPATLAALLEEYFIAAYYRDYPSQEVATEIARAYVDLICNDAAAREVFLRHEIRVRSNFGFLDERVGL